MRGEIAKLCLHTLGRDDGREPLRRSNETPLYFPAFIAFSIRRASTDQ
jgi:hypothetical protein